MMVLLLLGSPFILMAGLILAGLTYTAALALSVAIVALLTLHGHWTAFMLPRMIAEFEEQQNRIERKDH